jgi:AcrR family transcriptional regulator
MPIRKYESPVRAQAAAQKRDQVLDAAARLLRQGASVAMSMDAVARAAGVTRLTVYNQFQSRRGLLEAVFDRIAGAGGLGRIAEVMAMPDAAVAIERLADIFCEFWSHDAAIGRLTEAAGSDAEFAQTLAARNERRRKSLTILVERAAPKGIRAKTKRDTVDVIFALTSYAVFSMLSDGRSPVAAAALVKSACRGALDQLTEED